MNCHYTTDDPDEGARCTTCDRRPHQGCGDTQLMARYDVQVRLTGEDGNAFAIMGRVQDAMERAGLRDEARQYVRACLEAESYDALLRITMETVECW